MAHERGQQHGAEGDAEERGGKFHQAIGVVEPGHGAVAKQGSDLRIDEEAHLRDRHAQRRGRHQAQDAPHAFVFFARPARPDQHADVLEERDLEGKLQEPAEEDGPRERDHRPLEARRDRERECDEGQIEEHRRERRALEGAVGVEQARGERDQRHEEDVGKADAQHRHREREFLRVVREPVGAQVDDERCGDDADRGRDEERGRERREHLRRQLARRLLALAVAVVADHRHERLRERALGEEPPQQVGNAECDDEGVHREAGAEEHREQRVADESRDARGERHAAHAGGGPEEIHRKRPFIAAAEGRLPL